MKLLATILVTVIILSIGVSNGNAQTRVTVDRWATIRHWVINDRPATEKRVGTRWVGMPGKENLRPRVDYRLAIQWGPSMRIGKTENWLEHVQLRVIFEGWGKKKTYRSALQFYTDSRFRQPTSPPYRVHIDHKPTQQFHPNKVGIIDHAYFRVTSVRGPAWKMRYNIGLYGAVYQGRWRKVTAR